MNPMSQRPENMTKVLIQLKEFGVLDFAFYKDGMYKMGKDWYHPSDFDGWLSIKELKSKLDI